MHAFEQFLVAPKYTGRVEVDYVLSTLSGDGTVSSIRSPRSPMMKSGITRACTTLVS